DDSVLDRMGNGVPFTHAQERIDLDVDIDQILHTTLAREKLFNFLYARHCQRLAANSLEDFGLRLPVQQLLKTGPKEAATRPADTEANDDGRPVIGRVP